MQFATDGQVSLCSINLTSSINRRLQEPAAAAMITRLSRLSQSVLVSSTVRLKQLRCLLLLLLKFKANRIGLTLIAILLMPSNFWLFEVLASSGNRATAAASAASKRVVNSETFAADWQAVVDGSGNGTAASAKMRDIMMSRGAAKDSDWMQLCHSLSDCKLTFFRMLAAATTENSRVVGTVDLDVSRLQLDCLHLPDSDLLCAFLYHLMVQSLASANSGTNATVFKDVQFLKYIDETVRNPDTICRRAVATGRIQFLLWYTTLYHVLICTAGCMLHFTATTAAFVSTMKENGFLQLMFSNGLSVGVYWFVLLCVTLIESVIFASIFALSYGLHCPDFYPKFASAKLFAIFLAYSCSLASLSLLATVLLRSYHLIVVMTVVEILVIVAITVIGVSRLSDLPEKTDYLMNAMLAFPPGHLTQYVLFLLHPAEQLIPWPQSCLVYFRRVSTALSLFPAAVSLVAIYLDFLLVNGNGLRLPWLFLFSGSFWRPGETKVALLEEEEAVEGRPNIERVSGVPAIHIRDISMSYRSRHCCGKEQQNIQALNGISCTIYQNQITALIGHNGAGKTTLMRMLTGEEAPTAGLAVITGRIVTDPYERLSLRHHVSVCKQTDVLSPHLTVMESIELAALSKGIDPESESSSIRSMMEHLGISGKENVQSMDLSGGQMRKVCCIIALIGDPKVVMLDEPTSGLDPVSRRSLWRILQDYKPGRCIILCTQFMDEADILADRKLFMSGGKLICAGSSLFLKHLFGCSSIINVSLKSEADVSGLLASMPPGVKLVNQSKTELQLRVPASEPQVLADAVQKLEDQKTIVDAFGVSQANLDDIFMSLENVDSENVESAINAGQLISLVGRQSDMVDGGESSGSTPLGQASAEDSQRAAKSRGRFGSPTCCGTLAALMAMNLRRQARSRVHCLCRFVMPLVLIVMVGAVVYLEKQKHSNEMLAVRQLAKGAKGTSKEHQLEVAYRLQISEAVRLPLMSAAEVDYAVCVSDSEDPAGHFSEAWCGRMVTDATGVLALVKPRSLSLDSLLAGNDSVRALLHAKCRPWCPIVYSSWWNTSLSYNNQRSIIIGMYVQHNLFATTWNPSLRNFASLAEYFGLAAAGMGQAIRVSTIIDFESFYCFHQELLVFLVLFSVLPVTFMMDTVEDRATRVRQQMRVMGLRSVVYWVTTMAVHWIQYTVYMILSMLLCLQWDRYRSSFILCGVVLPLLLLGTWSNLLTVYCVGAFQRTPNHSVSTSHFFFVIFICSVTSFVMKNRTVCAVCIWLIPPLAPVMLAVTGLKVASYGALYYEKDAYEDVPELSRTFLAYPDTRHALVAMVTHIALQAGLLALVENWPRVSMILRCCRTAASSTHSAVDSDLSTDDGVRQEAERIRQQPRSGDNMLEVRGLQRTHPNGTRAVRGVTYGAAAGEILGLLGQNGAGKTSMMAVVVGEEHATEGCVEVRHRDRWMSGMEGASRGAVGYCPQHNPLFGDITVAEHLQFYARIRGLPSRRAAAQVAELIAGLGLTTFRDRRSRQLSGGNKRRLCLGVALLGSPSVLVIDEASTGVDPENKRGIWGAIRSMCSGGGRSVLITTHSMEEVEALCSRVGIMNKGVLIGFGTVQQLRSRHGEAYTLEVLFAKLPGGDNSEALVSLKEALAAEVDKMFPDSELLEDVCWSCQFRLPTKSIAKLSESIRWLANNQARLGLQYFSLHQMSLDQVFVDMMRRHMMLETEEQTQFG